MKLSAFTAFAAFTLSALTVPSVFGEGEEDNEFEWAGTFTVADTQHTWIMQKTGDPAEYVDPSMKLAVLSSTAIQRRFRKNRELEVAGCEPEDPLFESLEEAANALLSGTCTTVNEGETFGPFTETGECFELVNDQAKDTSKFIMDTSNIEGKVIFAQHVPIEFERDMHYLQDSDGTDVEPVSEKGGGHHDHNHGDESAAGPTCACEMAELNLNIDCSASAAMTDALAFLRTANCACDCDSDECQKNWILLQTHHDYCNPLDVPGDVNDSFHDFDEVCASCTIERQFIEGADPCPEPNCDDNSGNDAYAFLVENGCATGTNCIDNQGCFDNFITLRTVHDSCDHDSLTQDAEEGIHDLEGACAAAVCNTLESAQDNAAQLECADDGSFAASGRCAVLPVLAAMGAAAAMA